MQFKTIADIYSANDTIRENLVNTVVNLTEDQANLPSENGKWTIGAIVEHIAKVENSMMRICYKLLSNAESAGSKPDSLAHISKSFIDATIKAGEENLKFEAPGSVQPEGGIPIADSLEMMIETREKFNGMKSMFETIDGTINTFQHPAFGEMNAHDWLVLLGGHEARHASQIKRILALD